MEEFILNAFDLTGLSFRTDAGKERVMQALDYAGGLYDELKVHGGSLSRDRLLAILLIGITDDLLQQREACARNEDRLSELLDSLDELLSGHGF